MISSVFTRAIYPCLPCQSTPLPLLTLQLVHTPTCRAGKGISQARIIRKRGFTYVRTYVQSEALYAKLCMRSFVCEALCAKLCVRSFVCEALYGRARIFTNNFIMGQKVNPQGFRLGVSQKPISYWFAKNRHYSQLVLEDHFLRESIYKKFPNAGIAAIYIERIVDTIKIDISSARPRQLLGSFSKDQHLYTGIQDLREQLILELQQYRLTNLPFLQKKVRNVRKRCQTTSISSEEMNSEKGTIPQFIDSRELIAHVTIHIVKLSEPDASAACLAESIVEQLEKRIPFRRAMKQAITKAQNALVKGVKVQIAGRLNGAEIARSEWILKGRVPLHTLRAKVQYDSRRARTIYGLLGVKVWVFTDD